MSTTEIITLAALFVGMLGMFVSLRRQSAAGLDFRSLAGRQQDTETELLSLRSKVDRLETLLAEKEEMLRVVTKEVIGIQLNFIEAEQELARLGNTYGNCQQELAVAQHQIDALQSTVEKQAKDLVAMDEIQQDAEYHRHENTQLKGVSKIC